MPEKPSYVELEERINELEKQLSLDVPAKDAEHMLRILDCSPLVIYTKDLHGRYLTLNKQFEKSSGLQRKDVIFKTDFELFPEVTARKSSDHDRQVIETGTPLKVEEFSPIDGQIHTFISTKYPLTNDDGTVYGICGVSIDITERKKAEEVLLQNEKDLREARQINHLARWRLNLVSHQVVWTRELYNMYGLDPTLPPPPYNEHMKILTPESWEILSTSVAKIIETGIPYEIELETVREGGSNRWMWVRGEAIKDSAGNTIELWGTAQDITDRKRMEEKLRASEKKIIALLEYSPVCTKVVDLDFNLQYMSTSGVKMLNIDDISKFYGKPYPLYFLPESFRNSMTKSLKNARETGEIIENEGITVDLNGNKLWLHSTLVPVNDDNGRIDYILIVSADITARKEAENELKKAHEHLEDTNTALKVLLKKRDLDTLELQENIYSNYELMITPFLSKLKNRSNNINQQNLLEIIETNLQEIIAPFAKKLSTPMMSLTSSEIQIANMIKQGFTNKEIAQTLNCSKSTIDTHRENIRKKLGLTNKKVNLKTFLSNL
ncbi:MAG: PAS domain-containing protein [Desulfotalea sp.]